MASMDYTAVYVIVVYNIICKEISIVLLTYKDLSSTYFVNLPYLVIIIINTICTNLISIASIYPLFVVISIKALPKIAKYNKRVNNDSNVNI